MPDSKLTPGKASFVTDKHQIVLGDALQVGRTITAYGKLVKDHIISTSSAGTSHPRGADENLQLALIYGVLFQGQCIRLSNPQTVYMPSPDGPANGCGWSPVEFVEWNNLPKDWNTIHLQSKASPLADALLQQGSTPGAKPSALGVMQHCWLNTSNGLGPGDNLNDLWNRYVGKETYKKFGASQLAQCLRGAYPSGWSWVTTEVAQAWVLVSDALNVL